MIKSIPNAGYKILAVDDHLLSLKLLIMQLNQMGFTEIDTASNGEEAEAMLEKKLYDIIILDWAMPMKDGLAVLKDCRAQSKYKDVALVMLSSETQESCIIEALQSGATSYINKPATQEIIWDRMQSVLQWLEGRKTQTPS
jgi:two-component system chemotaxis response regulator CheY